MANCGCPSGYILDQNGNCIGTENVPAIVNQTTYTVGPAAYSTCYWGITGATFYPDITSLPFPLTASGGGITGFGCNPASPPVGTPTILTDASLNVLNPVTSVNNNVWGWVFSGGRLTNVGIATNPPSALISNDWIGFTFCQTLLTAKTYYIGIAGDDAYKLYINGQLIINHTTGFGFVDWKILPITLNAGVNIIGTRYIKLRDAP